MADEDRRYEIGLAAVREAGFLAQGELAQNLGRSKNSNSHSTDNEMVLYSTLLTYLEAVGATDVALSATVDGHKVEIALADVANHRD